MEGSQQSDSISYPLDQMNDASRHIRSQVAQSLSYRGHLQYLLTEVDSLPADIGNYLASCWNAWDRQVQDQHNAYTTLATNISNGSQAMDTTDQNVVNTFQPKYPGFK